MISRLTGMLVEIAEGHVLLQVDGITYELLVPTTLSEHLKLTGSIENELTFHTFYYIEGGVGMGNLTPRLVGFMNEIDREFFQKIISVQGLGVRKALKALSLPTREIARAIESGDIKTLTKLPEIGKRIASKIVADLMGKMAKYALIRQVPSTGEYVVTLPGFHEEALKVLGQLQYREAEAEELIRKALMRNENIDNVENLIQEIFRMIGER